MRAAWVLVALSSVASTAHADDAPRVILGAQVSSHTFHFDAASTTLSGTAFQIDGGVQVSPRYALYAFWEHGVYDSRDDRIAPGPLATSHAVGVGVQASTNPDGPWSFLVDLSSGYRFLRVPFDTGLSRAPYGVDRYQGLEPLRLHLGPTLLVDRVLRVEALIGGALGRFHASGVGHAETCAIVATCGDSLLVDGDTQSATYFTIDFGVALHTWL